MFNKSFIITYLLTISSLSICTSQKKEKTIVDDQFLPLNVVQCKNAKGEYMNEFRYETSEEYQERINGKKD